MTHDITFPEFADVHVTRWLKRHEDGGKSMPGREDMTSVRDWLTSLPDENPKMLSKLHKLNWDTAMKAQALWHDAMAKKAERAKEFGGNPDDVELVHDFGDGLRWVRVTSPDGLVYEGNATLRDGGLETG